MTPNEITIDKFILIIRSQLSLVAGIFLAALMAAIVITYVTPKMYSASAKLNFDIRGNPLDNQSNTLLLQTTYITTQSGIIESLHVAQQVEDSLTEYERERLISALNAKHSVIDDIRMAITSPVRALFSDSKKNKGKQNDQTPGGDAAKSLRIDSTYGWLAKSIGADLSVQPLFNSRIVAITYSSTDPKIAALMANRFAEAYIATNLQMFTDPAQKSKVWFNQQLTELRSRLEDAQSRLTKYQQKEGIVSSDERLDTENVRLKDLASQFIVAQQQTRNAETERQKLREGLGRGESLLTFNPVANNPVIQNINAEIRDLEGRRVQYSSTLGRNHPKMEKIESELREAKYRLSREIEAVGEGINNAAELARERERELSIELSNQKQLVLKLKNEHDKIAVLERDVESAQATYNAALSQLNTTSMQSMVEQANVSIVDTASVPGSHSSPQVITNLVLGALAGLLLGFGIAVLRGLLIQRVYSSQDIIAEIGVPLLGHLKKA